MIPTERVARLRLAARTLIEWKVPVSTFKYKTVVSDLLKIHPNAASWGLGAESKILQLDTSGKILWYLSETLDCGEPLTPLAGDHEDSENLSQQILDECLASLNYHATYESRNERFWGHVDGVVFAQALLESINGSDKEALRRGYQAWLGILVDDDELRHRLIDNLIIHSSYARQRSFVFRRLLYALKQSTLFNGVRVVVFGVALMLLCPLSNVWGLSAFGWESDQALVRAMKIGLVLVVLVLMLSPRLYEFLIGMFSSHLAFGEVEERLRIRTQSDSIRFQRMTGEVCGWNPQLLIALIMAKSRQPIAKYALDATTTTTVEAARTMLSFFASPEVKSSEQIQIFRWLCGVEIQESLRSTSVEAL